MVDSGKPPGGVGRPATPTLPSEVVLVITRQCNLACSYCYMGHSGPQYMSHEVLEKALRLAGASARDPGHHATGTGASAQPGVAFFGGEPLLAFDLIQHAVGLAGPDTLFTVCTNGTCVTDEIAEFLAQHRFLVQLSLDGCAEMHDVHRRTAASVSTHAMVMDGLSRLRHHGLMVDPMMVVTPDNVHLVERSFRFVVSQIGLPAVTINLDYLSGWDQGKRAILTKQFELVGDALIAGYRQGQVTAVSLLDEKIEAHISGGESLSTHCPFGIGRVAVNTNGDIYPCDRLIRDGRNPHLVIGHVDCGIDLSSALRLHALARQPKPRCDACALRERCRHWCGCVNMESTGSPGQVSEFFCFAEHLKARVADRVAATLYHEHNPWFLARFYGEGGTITSPASSPCVAPPPATGRR